MAFIFYVRGNRITQSDCPVDSQGVPVQKLVHHNTLTIPIRVTHKKSHPFGWDFVFVYNLTSQAQSRPEPIHIFDRFLSKLPSESPPEPLIPINERRYKENTPAQYNGPGWIPEWHWRWLRRWARRWKHPNPGHRSGTRDSPHPQKHRT